MRLASRDRQINFHPMNFVADASRLPRVVYKFDRDGSYSRSTDRRISSRYCFAPALFLLAHAALNYR